MKYSSLLFNFGAIIFSILANLPGEKSLAALPLQEGIYYGGGTRYIQIAQKNNKICYQGFSKNGTSVASVEPDRDRPGFYVINGFDGTVLFQRDRETLQFGAVNRLASYSLDSQISGELDATLEKCLNSDRPFFDRVLRN